MPHEIEIRILREPVLMEDLAGLFAKLNGTVLVDRDQGCYTLLLSAFNKQVSVARPGCVYDSESLGHGRDASKKGMARSALVKRFFISRPPLGMRHDRADLR